MSAQIGRAVDTAAIVAFRAMVRAGIIVAAYEDRPIGRLIDSQESGGHFESVLLRPKVTIESGDVDEALRLHQDAHKKCFIANSVNFPVLLEPAIQHASNA